MELGRALLVQKHKYQLDGAILVVGIVTADNGVILLREGAKFDRILAGRLTRSIEETRWGRPQLQLPRECRPSRQISSQPGTLCRDRLSSGITLNIYLTLLINYAEEGHRKII